MRGQVLTITPMTFPNSFRRQLLLTGLAIGLLAPGLVGAHDFTIGALRVDHPYALPAPAGVKTGGVYFRGIRNQGTQADRLIGARTERADSVQIHETVMSNDIARMRESSGIDLPARQTVQLRHGQRYHLMLVNLKQPLIQGDSFVITLQFEKAGPLDVQVSVQTPKAGQDDRDHKH